MENGKWKMENVFSLIELVLASSSNINETLTKTDKKVTIIASEVKQSYLLSIDKIKKYFFLLIITLCPMLYAQPVDSLISEALQNNPQLKALQSRITSAEYGSKSFGYLPPPTLGIEFNQIPTDKLNIWNDAMEQSISISQMFPLGGKLSAMENAERKNIDIAAADYDSYKLQLISGIKKLYYEIWLMQHHAELRNETVNLLQSIYESTELQYQVNRAAYSDLLLIQAEISSNKTEAEIIGNEIFSLIYKMNALLGRELNDNRLYVNHYLDIDTSFIDISNVENLLEENPSLIRMERITEMNQLQIEANNKELIPDLMIGGMLMRMPQGMPLTSKSNVHMLNGNVETEFMYGIMASITLPFAPWSSGKYSAKEEELLANIEGIRYEKGNMKRELITETKSLITRLQNLKNKILLYENEVIPLYKKTIEVQLTEFQNNRLPITSIIETVKMLLMKEEALAEVQAEYQILRAELEAVINGKW